MSIDPYVIKYNSGDPVFTDASKGTRTLLKGNSVQVQLQSGDWTEEKITGISFYHDAKKAVSAGSWTAPNTTSGLTAYTVSQNSDTQVTVTDNETLDPKATDPYWFSVSVTWKGGSKTVDPEMINSGGN